MNQARIRSIWLVAVGFATGLLLVVGVGCSSGGDDAATATTAPESPTSAAEVVDPTQPAAPEIEATATEAPAPTVAPTATVVPEVAPTATAAAAPTSTPVPVPTSTPAPTPTATPTPTPVPLTNIFSSHGFKVELDQDATFADSDLVVGGWTGADADSSQGLMAFDYNGAKVVIFWQPQDGASPQETVDLTYQLQQLGQPALTFTPLSAGDLTVDGELGKFVGFLTTDASGGGASGGLIGAWPCTGSATQISLTATGSDSTALQIRFDRITEGFSCAAN